MSCYRIEFKAKSPFSAYVESYTLFGALCWGTKLIFGEDKLIELLEKFKSDPPFLISSPLPLDPEKKEIYFPFSLPPEVFEKLTNISEYKIQKKLKKPQFLSRSQFLSFLKGEISLKELYLTLKNELIEEESQRTLRKKPEKVFKEANLLNNSLNRLTGTTLGGQLFNTPVYYRPYFVVFVYLRNKDFIKDLFNVDIKDYFKAIFEMVSLGGNKSVGFGKVEVKGIEEDKELESFLIPDNNTKFIYLLSPTLPDPGFDYSNPKSFYHLSVFFGFIDNTYERISKGLMKRKIPFLGSGSQLVLKQVKPFYGALYPVYEGPSFYSSKNVTVYQYGYAFPLYPKNLSLTET